MVEHACNPSPQEAKAGESQVTSSLDYILKTLPQKEKEKQTTNTFV